MGVLPKGLVRDVPFSNAATIEELLGPDDGPHKGPVWWTVPKPDDEEGI